MRLIVLSVFAFVVAAPLAHTAAFAKQLVVIESTAPDFPPGRVIEDAKPNRPTPQQMSNTLGLSLESFGVGGARISGQYVDPAGVSTPIAYAWYETDIRWARYGSTWHDAGVAFDRLAARLAKDQFSGER